MSIVILYFRHGFTLMNTAIPWRYTTYERLSFGSLARHWAACSGLPQCGEGPPGDGLRHVSPLLRGLLRPEMLQGRDRDSDSFTFHCSACSGFPQA